MRKGYTIYKLLVMGAILVGSLSIAVSEELDVEVEKKATISEIRILESGLFSSDTLVIKYNPENMEIVAIADNGEKVDKDDFYKYRDKLNIANEIDVIDEVATRVERKVEKIIKEVDGEVKKVEELTKVIEMVDGYKSKELQEVRVALEAKMIDLLHTVLQEDIVEFIKRNDLDISTHLKELKFEDGIWEINGTTLSKNHSKELLEIYNKHSKDNVSDDDEVVIIYEH